MEIRFCLAWLREGGFRRKAFKLEGASSLFKEYVDRISQFVPCEVARKFSPDNGREAGMKAWVCDRGLGAKQLTSEDLARLLGRHRDSGTRRLDIVIGGPDGFSKIGLEELKPDLRWSFGPMTLPHELAAVVASEQIYRACTIIRGMPYHSGHQMSQ